MKTADNSLEVSSNNSTLPAYVPSWGVGGFYECWVCTGGVGVRVGSIM